MGNKLGINGIDNGFVTFYNVRIPRENLLNKTGDVTPAGRYVTPFKVKYCAIACRLNALSESNFYLFLLDLSKRFGVNLGVLSNGRVVLTFYAHCFMVQALTIAIRYAAVRKQFGNEVGREQPIIEYPLHVNNLSVFDFWLVCSRFCFRSTSNIGCYHRWHYVLFGDILAIRFS
jgi:acyl-CoA oxidase